MDTLHSFSCILLLCSDFLALCCPSSPSPAAPKHVSLALCPFALCLGLQTPDQHVPEIRGPRLFHVGQGHRLYHSDSYKDWFDESKAFFHPYFFTFKNFILDN